MITHFFIDSTGNATVMSTFVRTGVPFHISPTEYEVGAWLGRGAYGDVCRATKTSSGELVAIKKIPLNNPQTCLRTLREIKLLRHLRHENIVSILDCPQPPGYDRFKEVYIVLGLVDTDLRHILRTQRLGEDHCQYFIYQILRAVKFIHSAGVIHRDLKPENILINEDCELKICDFGLARVCKNTDVSRPNMTEYVATRWYRAPEIMINAKKYTKAIDLWSTGCILFEMMSGRVLFPGKDYTHQVNLILNVLGSPTEEDYAAIPQSRSKQYIMSLPHREKRPWKHLIPAAKHDGLHLIDRLLTFNHSNRATAEEALEHPYVAEYHDADDEPTATSVGEDVFSSDLEGERPSGEHLRRRR